MDCRWFKPTAMKKAMKKIKVVIRNPGSVRHCPTGLRTSEARQSYFSIVIASPKGVAISQHNRKIASFYELAMTMVL